LFLNIIFIDDLKLLSVPVKTLPNRGRVKTMERRNFLRMGAMSALALGALSKVTSSTAADCDPTAGL
jgi:hypothetical protein